MTFLRLDGIGSVRWMDSYKLSVPHTLSHYPRDRPKAFKKAADERHRSTTYSSAEKQARGHRCTLV